MTNAQKHVREYLARIGARGGFASRRELTKSHARQMGRYSRSEARGVESWQAVAASRSQIALAP